MRVLSCILLVVVTGFAVNVEIDYTEQSPISPLIYGYNQNHEDSTQDEMNLACRRLGGNRMSTFNWERNVENAGEGNNQNWLYIHNTIVKALWNDQHIAGATYAKFHQDNLDNGLTSVVTVPLLGWVAADDDRLVSTGPHGADSLRWKQLVYAKGSAFTLTPDTSDRVVYLDECINYFVETYGGATAENGIKYIALGNEPGLWNSTHDLVQETQGDAAEYVQKVVAAAAAIKSVDPDVKIIAGEFSGIRIYDFGPAPDWGTEGAGYDWFISYFLDKLKQASDSVGYNLIDIISVHNYPQHKVDASGDFSGSGTVVRQTTGTAAYLRETRMDFARSLWDTTYIEPSWLTGSKLGGEPNNIIGRIQNSIDTYFPGIKIMFGELDYGDNQDISHGIAIADMLGVMATEGVEIVNRWELEVNNDNTYTQAAYKLFRNYDGLKSTYGDIALAVNFDERDSASLWASIDSASGDLHLIVLNKSLTASQSFNVPLESGVTHTIDTIVGFDASSHVISEKALPTTWSDSVFNFSVPALTACHIVIERDGVTPSTSMKTPVTSGMTVSVKGSMLFIENVSGPSRVTLYSANGQIVQQTSNVVSPMTLQVSPGIYSVRVHNSVDGTVTKKVIFR